MFTTSDIRKLLAVAFIEVEAGRATTRGMASYDVDKVVSRLSSRDSRVDEITQPDMDL